MNTYFTESQYKQIFKEFENFDSKINRKDLREIVRRIITLEKTSKKEVTLIGDLNMQLKSLEKEVWEKFSLDEQISFEQAKPAVRYIIARLRGDLERQFTDKKFRVLFREIDVNNNGKIDRAELNILVKKLASFDEEKDEEKFSTLQIERLLKEVKNEFNFTDD